MKLPRGPLPEKTGHTARTTQLFNSELTGFLLQVTGSLHFILEERPFSPLSTPLILQTLGRRAPPLCFPGAGELAVRRALSAPLHASPVLSVGGGLQPLCRLVGWSPGSRAGWGGYLLLPHLPAQPLADKAVVLEYQRVISGQR